MVDLLAGFGRPLRGLLRAPGFAVVAILTLALGIGGTVSVFSVVNAILLRPLPYPRQERLVGLWHAAPGLGMERAAQSDASYLQYRKATRLFEELGAYAHAELSLTGDQEPERVQGARITATLLPTLGTGPAIGRGFGAADDHPDAAPVVIRSHALWRRRYGGEPSVVGRTIQVDGVAHEVVGIMPPSFAFPGDEVQLWLPLRLDTGKVDSGTFRLSAVARLRSKSDRRSDARRIVFIRHPVGELANLHRRASADPSGLSNSRGPVGGASGWIDRRRLPCTVRDDERGGPVDSPGAPRSDS